MKQDVLQDGTNGTTTPATEISRPFGSIIVSNFRAPLASWDLNCPPGSFVTSFFGGSGRLIDTIGINCSDASSIGPVGGPGNDNYGTKLQHSLLPIRVCVCRGEFTTSGKSC
jgi:hypothetical protein